MSTQSFSTYPEVYFGELKRNYTHTHTHTHTQNRTCYVKRDMGNKSSNNYLVVSKWKLVEVSFHSCAIKITVSAPG